MDSPIVEVLNTGTTTHLLRYAGDVYPVNPGQRVPVPVTAVKRSVGDWERVDDPDSNHMPRTRERDRLITLYGLAGDAPYSDDPIVTLSLELEAQDGNKKVKPADYDPIDAIDGRKRFMHPNLPRLEVYDIRGNRIITILDDPDGDLASGAAFRRLTKATDGPVEQQIAALQGQLNALTDQLAQSNPAAARDLAIAQDAPMAPVAPPPPESDASAMDVMTEELGLDNPTDPSPAPKTTKKKSATKKAAARREVDA